MLLATPEQELIFQGTFERKSDQAQRTILKKIPCPAAKQFAAYGIFSIIEELSNVHLWEHKTENLERTLINAMNQKAPPDTLKSLWQEITKLLKLSGIYDQNGDIKHPEHFYTKSGIKTIKGDYYTSAELNPAAYGWRIGRQEDAVKLGLTKVAAPAGRSAMRSDGLANGRLLQQVQDHAASFKEWDRIWQIVDGARGNESLRLVAELAKKAEVDRKAATEIQQSQERRIKYLEDQVRHQRERSDALESQQKSLSAAMEAMEAKLENLAFFSDS